MKQTQRLVLLDAHAILHRAYHALPDFATSQGVPTGALYGFSTMVMHIVSQFKPDYIVGCFDLPKPTYRHVAYEAYKTGRVKTDDALVSQLKKAQELCVNLGIPVYSLEGFEADDMLGTIVHTLKDSFDIEILIASGDMDTLQLVTDDKVRVFTLKKGIHDTIIYNEDKVIERFGFTPKQIPDYKGLRGDTSDNIIGIKGIGEKTATILIKEFGTVEGMYQALEQGDERFRKVGLAPRMIELIRSGKEEALFSKMLATIRVDAPIQFSLPSKTWREGINEENIIHLFGEYEFRSLPKRFKELLAELDGTQVEKTEILESAEVVDPALLRETLLALWVVDSNYTNPTIEDVYTFAQTRSFEKARQIITTELTARQGVYVFEAIEKPLIPVIDQMRTWGIAIDLPHLASLKQEYRAAALELEKQIHAYAGTEFNIASPKQLAEVLFNSLGLKGKNQKKTSTGQLSTKESELEKLKDAHPIIPCILSYRELTKLLSTYIEVIPTLTDTAGRLHSTLLQMGTTTGRMASEDPNIQNIPIKSALGRRIRSAFVAEPGWVLVSCDYSQIELRCAAILSGDERLMEIFKNNEDIHRSVASRVFHVSPSEVTPEMRRKAKVINFGILYGMGANALKANLEEGGDVVSRADAQTYLDEYFKEFSGVAAYIEETIRLATAKGYTETLFGRRRYFENIKSRIPYIKAQAERMAMNAPIQGTNADITKLAMQALWGGVLKQGARSDVRMLLQIHDELLFEIKEEVFETIIPELLRVMESVVPAEKRKGVPIRAEAKFGKNWGEMKSV
jgi:DNA polymerase-1